MAAKRKATQASLLSFFPSKVVAKDSSHTDEQIHPAAADLNAVDDTSVVPTSKQLEPSKVPDESTPIKETACSVENSGKDKCKHASAFHKSWLRDYPWLLFDEHRGGMFCQLCVKYDKRPFESSVWNEEPCKRIRLESVRKHDDSQSHRDSVKLEAYSKVAVSPLEIAQQPASRTAMRQAFACLYHLCKHRIAHTTNYEPLLDLLGVLGLNVKADMTAGKNATYCSQRSIQEMVTCLSSITEAEILQEVQQSEHYALMFDETTDCTTVEQLVIHCRYIFGGNLKVKFLSMIDVLKSGDPKLGEESVLALSAVNIASAVEQCMMKKGLAFDKLRGIGTDGAPVMTGKKGGAVKLLTEKQKAVTAPDTCQALGIHCGAHKLNLAANQAAGAVPYVKKFKDLLQQLYNFYACSPVRAAGLKAVQKILDAHQAGGKITEPCDTRWLGVAGSCTAVRNNLAAITVSLSREAEERSDVRAAGLLKFVMDVKFVGALLMMCEVLPNVERLSKALQSRSLHMDLVQGMIRSTLKTLDTEKDSQTKVQDFCSSQDISLTVTKESEHWLEATKRTFITKLMENIKDRFEDHPTLTMFSTLFARGNYESILAGNGAEISNALATLCPMLGKAYNPDMLGEWKGFAHLVLDSEKLQKLAETEFLLCVATDINDLYPTVAHIAGAYLVLPPHTADCERDFSALKLIKTQLRNRLKEESLDCLVRLACEGPSVKDFPYDKVVEKWAKLKNRRLKL